MHFQYVEQLCRSPFNDSLIASGSDDGKVTFIFLIESTSGSLW